MLRASELNGEAQDELAPFTRFRYRDDFALVETRQLSRQVEAEPGAGHVVEGSQAAEADEQPIHVLGGNADTLVSHAQQGRVARRRELRGHIATLRRVLD